MSRFLAGLLLGLVGGAGLVTYYWWRSDQIQADALTGWEWHRGSHAERGLTLQA